MRVRQAGRRCALLVLVVAAATAREVIGPAGPAWMQPPKTGRQVAGDGRARNITNSPGEDRDPVWSADGTLIAFASNRAGTFDIYLARTDGSNPDTGVANSPKVVANQAGNERYPAFSPGGTEVAYVRSGAIYVLNLRTSVENLVASDVGDPTDLVFSFDGQRLAYSTLISGTGGRAIFWVSLDPNDKLQDGRRRRTRITPSAPYDNLAPAWFPDQNRILFASRRDGDLDIFMVTVPGPDPANGEGNGVPENQWLRIVGGAGNQTQPAWLNPGGISDAQWHNGGERAVLYADDRGGNHYDVRLADLDGVPAGGVDVFTDNTATNPAQQTEPFANPQQSSSSNLCVFAGNQSGNYELYTTTTFDTSPPILGTSGGAQVPTVAPQRTLPGATVTITAPVFDIGSGVKEVWAIIRRAEVPVYQQSSNFAGYDDAGVLGGGTTPNYVTLGRPTVEFDQMIVDVQNGNQNFDPTTLGAVTAGSLLNLVRTRGLRLRDDGTGGDATPNDGVYTAQYTTNATAQDYYVDIIPIDNRDNVPVDTNLGFNSRPGGGGNDLLQIDNGFNTPFHVIGYDHVAGFTTRTLDLTRKILFVSDYGCGQKFQVADFAGADQTSLTRYWTAALPVEHYYFLTDDSQGNSPTDRPEFINVGTAAANVFFAPYGFQSGFPPPAGSQTADNAMAETGVSGVFGPYGGPNQQDRAAVWRILCRGPVDASTLNAYSPLPLTPPPAPIIPAQDADRMLLWVAPYSGDLFVQKGTILDADTQNALTSFMAAGGRLFVSGQDIAWALTKNGSQANSFLSTVLRAQFVSDAPSDVANQTVQTSGQRHAFTIGSAMTGIETQVFQTAENPILFDMYPDFYRWYKPNPINYHPPGHSDEVLRTNQGGGLVGWAGTGCPNQWFVDDVNAVNDGVPTLNYAGGGATAMIRHINSGTGGRVVFCAFGFEALRGNFRYHAGFRTNQNWVIGHGTRVEMFANISDYLRTGGLLGKVVGPDGTTPIGGINVVARVGFNPANAIMATTTTLADGTYLLRGLSTSNYSVYVVSNEYTADHRPYVPVFGGQISQDSDLSIRLLKFDNGTIFGTVKNPSGETIAGAEVTVTLETTGSNPFSQKVNTDNNGAYSVDVPGGAAPGEAALYTVSAAAAGFGSASATGVSVVAGDNVQVDLVLEPAPGTLSGVITGSGQPVSGATVVIQRAGVTVATLVTNVAGTFTRELSQGSYDVIVTAPGFQQATQTGIQVVSDEVTTVTLDLSPVPPGSLTGLVTLQGSTAPVGGVTVSLLSGGSVLRTTTTAASATTQDGDTYNYRFDNVAAGTYDVKVTARGFSEATRSAVSVVSNRVTTDIDFQLQPLHTFIAGLSMTSTPFDYSSSAPDIQTLIDDDPADPRLRLAVYDTIGQRYVLYPTPPANTFRLGKGYFMRLSQNVALTTEGIRAPTVGSGFDIQLIEGWNLIGHVYEFPVDLFACKVVFQGAEISLQDASARGLLNASLYTLNFNQYQQVFRLDPYTAYWVRAFQNVILRVPPTSLSAGRQVTGRQAPTGDQWLAEVVATGADGRQARASFGVAAEAGPVHDGRDRAQPPQPPTGGLLELTFPHPDWGRYADRYQTDVRGGGGRHRWLMEVNGAAGEAVELTWPALGAAVPGALGVVLEDLETGVRRSLRHTTAYRVVLSGTGSRQVAIEAAPQTSRARITSVSYAPGRGGGGTLNLAVSAPLTVSVEVRGARGRLVRQVERATSRAAGAWAVTWDGRDEQGRPVPSGTYTVVVIGVSDTGEQVREVRTIQYRR